MGDAPCYAAGVSFTRLVAYSIVPAALVALGLGDTSGGLFIFAGLAAEAFVLARFLDRRR